MHGQASKAPEDAAAVIEAMEPSWIPEHIRDDFGLPPKHAADRVRDLLDARRIPRSTFKGDIPGGRSFASPLLAWAPGVAVSADIVIAHAVLGTLLLIGAVTVLIRAVRTHSPLLIALAALALAAIIAAWLSGARFVGTTTNSASLAMAIATGIAILAYILILFPVANPATRREARREGAAGQRRARFPDRLFMGRFMRDHT
jgi:hypothetical protein